MNQQIEDAAAPSPDELNRLWQHGLHEERLFHDRLKYFSAVEIGLLSVFAILYNKDQPVGLLIPLTGAALAFTIFWLVLQYNHWRCCVYINSRIRELVPEYRHTVETYFGHSKSQHPTTALSLYEAFIGRRARSFRAYLGRFFRVDDCQAVPVIGVWDLGIRIADCSFRKRQIRN